MSRVALSITDVYKHASSEERQAQILMVLLSEQSEMCTCHADNSIEVGGDIGRSVQVLLWLWAPRSTYIIHFRSGVKSARAHCNHRAEADIAGESDAD